MSAWRLAGIGFVFCIASVAWLVLGATMSTRTNSYSWDLRDQVAELWGRPQTQQAPDLTFTWDVERLNRRSEMTDSGLKVIEELVVETQRESVSPDSTKLTADLKLDQRRKGLIWYSLYDLDFSGAWTYHHDIDRAGRLFVAFTFPDSEGIYDGFTFKINGMDRAADIKPVNGQLVGWVDVEPGDDLKLDITYKTRGLDDWSYKPSEGVGSIEDFSLVATTDFATIDFPRQTLSPSGKVANGEGWQLTWDFDRVVTGHGMGLVMPKRIQPGELATEMSVSAPVSLLFFFVILFVLGAIRRIEIHPINYLFVASAFFAFHLLFAYTVDVLPVEWAFVLCSVVSMALVVSYMRLVVSSRFAFFETALAQLIYLVGFSLAHFWDAYTGLTVTVLSILTLFVLMQLTGRMKWGEVLGKGQMTNAAELPAQ